VFFSWKKRKKSPRQRERERLIPKVKEVHKQSKESYGARRITEELEAQGGSWGEQKGERL